MKTITLRNTVIGAGPPKIIVPIVGETREEIIAKANELKGLDIDAVEWRADFYQDALKVDHCVDTLKRLRSTIGQKLILFTFRTAKEGGMQDISDADYTALNEAVAKSGDADLIDIEAFYGNGVAEENIKAIHEAGCKVVGSYHGDDTPPREKIVDLMVSMQDMGIDIPKISVLPLCTADVLTLLAASAEMYEKYADRPFFTMSTTSKGVVSRIACEAFGSSLAFGSSGKISAPGQIPFEELMTVHNLLHKYLNK